MIAARWHRAGLPSAITHREWICEATPARRIRMSACPSAPTASNLAELRQSGPPRRANANDGPKHMEVHLHMPVADPTVSAIDGVYIRSVR